MRVRAYGAVMHADLAGGGRFAVAEGAGEVVKTGPPGPLAREAAALALLAGRAPVPDLVGHDGARLVTRRLPGTPRPLGAAGGDALRALGRALAAVHGAAARATATGADPAAPRVWSAAAYGRRRRADALALAARAGLRPPSLPPPAAALPFRPVHGDLVAGNVVWDGDRPALVDWEFWRWGDPAEDLAYLAEVNDLGAAEFAAVCDGHGDPGAAARAAGWRPLVALEAGAWWWAEGRHLRAAPLLRRAGVSPPTPPSARTSPGPHGGRAGTTSPPCAPAG